MCGRYQLTAQTPPPAMQNIIDEILRRYDGKPALQKLQLGEVRPTDVVPVLANSKNFEVRPFLMRWGFSGGKGGSVINARSESAHEKPMFSGLLHRRRCLVPAAHYFEWDKATRAKYQIEAAGEMLYMAGLYRYEDDPALPAFTILTRAASPQAGKIHPRMPVILPGSVARKWLAPEADIAKLIAAAEDDVQLTPLSDVQQKMEF